MRVLAFGGAMTVEELIQQLQALNMPKARVVTPGFDEAGLDDVATPVVVNVVFHDGRNPIHSGPHELIEVEEGSEAFSKIPAPLKKAVLLNF
jgi:hypothetical protein